MGERQSYYRDVAVSHIRFPGRLGSSSFFVGGGNERLGCWRLVCIFYRCHDVRRSNMCGNCIYRGHGEMTYRTLAGGTKKSFSNSRESMSDR